MKKTTLTLILTFSLIGILIVATIIAGFSTKSFMPSFAAPSSIAFAYDSANLQSVNPGTEEYEELKSTFENAFKKSSLTAMFDGSNKNSITATNTTSTQVSKTGTYIRYDYVDVQTLRVGGVAFTNGSGVEVTYNSIWMTLADDASFNTVRIYLTLSIERYNCYVTSSASTQDLFTLVEELAQRHLVVEE